MAPSTAHQLIQQWPRTAGSARGSALIVSLVLLLVITVTGIAGMAGAVLQERMAGNLQDGTQIFEASEAVLRRCAQRVLDDNTTADGTAEAQTMADFRAGRGVTIAAGPSPELHNPDSLHSDLATQGATGYQLACLIEFDGTVPAPGDSLRRPKSASSFVGYTVTVAGARKPDPSNTNSERPSKILEARVVLRR